MRWFLRPYIDTANMTIHSIPGGLINNWTNWKYLYFFEKRNNRNTPEVFHMLIGSANERITRTVIDVRITVDYMYIVHTYYIEVEWMVSTVTLSIDPRKTLATDYWSL